MNKPNQAETKSWIHRGNRWLSREIRMGRREINLREIKRYKLCYNINEPLIQNVQCRDYSQ